MKRIFSILTLLLISAGAYSQIQQREIEIYFDQGNYAIDYNIRSNTHSLSTLSKLLEQLQKDTLTTVIKIQISSFASPEGGHIENQRLSKDRSEVIHNYLVAQRSIPSNLIDSHHSGVAWDQLRDVVSASTMPYREEVLSIIDNTPEETWKYVNPTDRWLTLTDSRNKQLMDLRGGVPYNYILKHIYPSLRASCIVTTYHQRQFPVIALERVVTSVAATTELELPYIHIPTTPKPQTNRSIMALKTNLIHNIALVPNIGVETTIAKKLSVDLPLNYSPFIVSSNYTLKVLSTAPELRYWLNKQMSGHFVGAHAVCGIYNVALLDNTRYQTDKIAYGGGISYGYALPFNDFLGLEFTIGTGYIYSSYDLYYNVTNGVKFDTKTKAYWGVTKAGISLVYRINRRVQ